MSFKKFYNESIQQWAGDKLYDGYTSVGACHKHLYEVNASGDGTALPTEVDGHYHDVSSWNVLETLNHTHIINKSERT